MRRLRKGLMKEQEILLKTFFDKDASSEKQFKAAIGK